MVKNFRNIHIYLSLFFLPVALMYALTGIVYICGFNQDVGATKQTYILTQNIEKGKEVEAITEFLKNNNLAIPSNLTLKKGKNGTLEIGGVHYSVSLMQTSDSTYNLTTLKRSILGDMIMLHKAKAMWYFNVLAIGFGLTLVLLYVSGLMITLFNIKKNRKSQYVTLILGFAITLVIGILSVA